MDTLIFVLYRSALERPDAKQEVLKKYYYTVWKRYEQFYTENKRMCAFLEKHLC